MINGSRLIIYFAEYYCIYKIFRFICHHYNTAMEIIDN